MVEITLKKNREKQNKSSHCYSCGKVINNHYIKRCPKCNTILNPNDYINWKISWYGFLCCLCLIPIIIMLIFIVF